MKTKITVFLIFIFFSSCDTNNNRNLHLDFSDIKMERIKIKRYEKAIFSIDKKNISSEIKRLAPEYPFFLSANIKDTLNIIQINTYLSEPRIQDLYSQCLEKYPEISDIEADLTNAFGYMKYYYPEFKIPKVYTYVSDLFYEQPIIYLDSILLIALDMYLGANNKYYPMLQIPVYQSNNYTNFHIVNDCINEIAKKQLSLNKLNPNFLDRILFQGKLLYFKDAILPDTHDSIKMGYTTRQEAWCKFNEGNLWSFFIDKKILYVTDKSIVTPFVSPGPFTTGLSKNSPARTGIWTGWQIIRSYMNNNEDIDINQMFLENDAQKILSLSKYKPQK